MVFWVFGYGSLVWNPGFEYDEKVIGFIKDYRRVFDLGKVFLCMQLFIFIPVFNLNSFHYCLDTPFPFAACIDHRGTRENPARTCTLEQKEGDICVSSYFIFMTTVLCSGSLVIRYLPTM